MIKTFKDIIVWQKAHQLTLEIYRIVKDFPRFEEFALANQMRRCAISVPSNIAEGFNRRTTRDKLHFYIIADGSLEELKYQLLLSKDLNYIDKDCYSGVMNLADEVGRLLNGWKNSQK